MKFTPKYDKSFYPLSVKLREYKAQVEKEDNKLLRLCIERNDGYNYIYELNIFSDKSKQEENYQVAERIIKSILWVTGGYKIYINGDDYIFEKTKYS